VIGSRMIPDGKQWSPSTARAVERRKCHKPPMDSLHVCSRLRAHHWSSPQEGLAGIVNEGDRSIDRPTRLFLPSSLRGCMLTRPSLRPPTLAPLIVEAIVTGLAYLQVERGHHDRFGVWVKVLLSRKPKAPRQLALAHRPQSSSPEPSVANQWRY
jgi:hypothetical protein